MRTYQTVTCLRLLVSFGGFTAHEVGVLAFFVRQKIQEIGICLALGADQNVIITWISRQGGWLIFATAGLIAAIAFSRLLRGLLFEVSSRDIVSRLQPHS
jgi:hypothetical protein